MYVTYRFGTDRQCQVPMAGRTVEEVWYVRTADNEWDKESTYYYYSLQVVSIYVFLDFILFYLWPMVNTAFLNLGRIRSPLMETIDKVNPLLPMVCFVFLL